MNLVGNQGSTSTGQVDQSCMHGLVHKTVTSRTHIPRLQVFVDEAVVVQDVFRIASVGFNFAPNGPRLDLAFL